MLQDFMYDDFFAKRLSELRNERKISAREMSLAIGQNESYINRIENRVNMPSMQGFFYICEYLNISPQEFFNTELNHPLKIHETLKMLNQLDEQELDAINYLLHTMVEKNKTTVK